MQVASRGWPRGTGPSPQVVRSPPTFRAFLPRGLSATSLRSDPCLLFHWCSKLIIKQVNIQRRLLQPWHLVRNPAKK